MSEPAAEQNEFLRRIGEIIDEIQRHKWLESEKVGRDIGGNIAALDWLTNHYEGWKRSRGYA